MAFAYDPADRCVRDPYRDWTLWRVQQYRDGECDFCVEGSGRRIAFTARSKAIFPGPVIHWLVWKVNVTGGAGYDETPQQIIEEALAVYKQLNALPKQGRVQTKFVDDTA